MTKDLVKDKVKYGILHIPTSLVLKTYLYDSDNCEGIDDHGEELLFPTKELAEETMNFLSTTGYERKRGKLSDKEKAFIESMSYYNRTAKAILPVYIMKDYLFSHRLLEVTVGKEETNVEWTPSDSAKILSKFNLVECIWIPDSAFYRAAGFELDEEDYDEFKKKTGYFINRYDLYPKAEFEIVEITEGLKVKRPSTNEFKMLVHQILTDSNAPQHIVDKVKQYIKD